MAPTGSSEVCELRDDLRLRRRRSSLQSFIHCAATLTPGKGCACSEHSAALFAGSSWTGASRLVSITPPPPFLPSSLLALTCGWLRLSARGQDMRQPSNLAHKYVKYLFLCGQRSRPLRKVITLRGAVCNSWNLTDLLAVLVR